jgi:capsid protein
VGVYNLPSGQEQVPFQNTSPGTAFNVFVDAQIAYIAAAVGQSIETVLMKFSNNYSASRATLILCWRIALQRRYNLACYHLDPVYEMWLSEEIAAGRVSAPRLAGPPHEGRLTPAPLDRRGPTEYRPESNRRVRETGRRDGLYHPGGRGS